MSIYCVDEPCEHLNSYVHAWFSGMCGIRAWEGFKKQEHQFRECHVWARSAENTAHSSPSGRVSGFCWPPSSQSARDVEKRHPTMVCEPNVLVRGVQQGEWLATEDGMYLPLMRREAPATWRISAPKGTGPASSERGRRGRTSATEGVVATEKRGPTTIWTHKKRPVLSGNQKLHQAVLAALRQTCLRFRCRRRRRRSPLHSCGQAADSGSLPAAVLIRLWVGPGPRIPPVRPRRSVSSWCPTHRDSEPPLGRYGQGMASRRAEAPCDGSRHAHVVRRGDLVRHQLECSQMPTHQRLGQGSTLRASRAILGPSQPRPFVCVGMSADVRSGAPVELRTEKDLDKRSGFVLQPGEQLVGFPEDDQQWFKTTGNISRASAAARAGAVGAQRLCRARLGHLVSPSSPGKCWGQASFDPCRPGARSRGRLRSELVELSRALVP